MSSRDFRTRLVRFYEHYEGGKAGEVDKLVAKCGGDKARQEQLMDALTDKYGPEPLVSDPEDLRRRVTALYRRYNPSKLGTVDNLVQRTKKKAKYEQRLLGMLVDKYGEEPEEENEEGAAAPARPAPAARKQAAAERDEDEDGDDDDDDDDDAEEDEADEGGLETFRQRLTRFYEHYAKDKLAELPKLLEKTDGKWQNEEKLMEMLVKKYGPELPRAPPKAAAGPGASKAKEAPKGAAAAAAPAKVPTAAAKAPVKAPAKAPAPSAAGDDDDDDDDDDDGGEDDDEDDEEDEDEAGQGGLETFQQRLTRFYEHYAKDKLAELPKLLEKTSGKWQNEEKLMELLVKKYGPELPRAPPKAAAVAAAPTASKASKPKEAPKEVPGKSGKGKAAVEQAGVEAGDEEAEQGEEEGERAGAGPGAIGGAGLEDSGGSLLRKVIYCPVDGMPPEYSEYLPSFLDCLPWLEEHCPDLVLTTKSGKTVGEVFDELNGGEAGEEGAKSRRGGAGVPNKARKKGAKGEQVVVIERAQRQKRKFVTSVVGLDTFDVKLKEAAKRLGKKFACGASINKLPDGRESIDIQGDYIYEMPDTVLEFFPEVEKSKVFLLEDGKKVKAFS